MANFDLYKVIMYCPALEPRYVEVLIGFPYSLTSLNSTPKIYRYKCL
jgi:hypothetical protein